MPYRLIGEGLALMLIILAFREATEKGRIFLVSLVILTYFLPSFVSFPGGSLTTFLTRLAVGVGCYLYIKFQAYMG